MSRGQGRVYRRPGTRNWWLDYSVRGARHQEPSGTSSRAAALRILRDRVGGRDQGTLLGRPDHVVFAEYETAPTGVRHLVGGLRALAERQYQLDGRRSLERLQQALNRLEGFFGADARVP